MYQIIIVPINTTQGTNIVLWYKTKEIADIAYANVQRIIQGKGAVDVLVQGDDFGHALTIEREKTSYVLFVDIEKQMELQAFRSIPPGAQLVPPSKMQNN